MPPHVLFSPLRSVGRIWYDVHICMRCSRYSLPVYSVLTLLTVWILGCSRPKGPGVYVSDSGKTIAEMSDRDVIFKVNGRAVKKGDFLRMQRLQAKIYERANSRRPGFTKESVLNYLHANEQRLLPMMMQRELFTQAARAAGVSVSEAEVGEMAKTLLSAYGLKSRTLSDARAELGGEEGETIADIISCEALSQKGVRALCRGGWLRVSEQEITNHLDRVRKFNEDADVMNKRAREILLKAKAEIQEGAKFADVAKKYAEVSPEQGSAWQTVELGELVAEGEAQLRAWLVKAEPGDISDPIDMDDGIAIVGVVRKGEGEVPDGMAIPTLYTLVRCTMYARQNMETPTSEEARDMIAEFKLGEARKEVGAEFYNNSVIEFPNGTNFFGRIESR